MKKSETDYDVVIIGGGMVGASMAVALSGNGLRIAVVEAFPFRSNEQPSYDARSIALAYGSKRIFETLKVWPAMQAEATPIKKIHVSDQGQFGITRLCSDEEGVDALGYVIENRVVGKALLSCLEGKDDVEIFCPASLTNMRYQEDAVELELDKQGSSLVLRARLCIAADGGNSPVRRLLNIDATRWEYGQTAIITTLTPKKRHQNIAYERFTQSGPLALLPMTDNRCSLVLTVRNQDVDDVLALDDKQFMRMLNERFGHRMGVFVKTAKRIAYPLTMMRAKEHIRDRVVIIGNAAHTVHPIAGQGFNLGIRDVSVLAQIICAAYKRGDDIGNSQVLDEYVKLRKRDHLSVIAFTDSMARIFSNQLGPLAHVRSKGLVAVDLLPPLKHFLAKRAMGIGGRLPKLSRGVSL